MQDTRLMETQKFHYDNNIVRAFLYATIVFGIIGFILGLTAALMLFILNYLNFYLELTIPLFRV
ncbi:hypothetical protein [Chryseobacterium indoltheticum]|uniref:hypothetical protein n=1 Tax=Chryseobacterium indoltheticum TaxID=254 RepID=UPI003F49781D